MQLIILNKYFRKFVSTVAGKKSSQKCPSGCTKIKRPTCGSDGRIYSNECLMKAANCDKVDDAGQPLIVFEVDMSNCYCKDE